MESTEVIELLAGKWVLPILSTLESDAARPADMGRRIAGISAKALHSTLRRLQEHRLITRSEHPGVPSVVEYTLTDDGRDMINIARRIANGSEPKPGGGVSDDAPVVMYGPARKSVPTRRPTVSPDTSSTARMYDYYLGGKDNYAADRTAAERVLSVYPEIRDTARSNRAFMERAVRFLTAQGIRQFIDLGTGIPTSPNVHEIARETIPDAHVAYVDNDPVVTVHNRAFRQTDGVIAVDMDIRNIDEVRRDRDLQTLIDFDQPIAVLLVSMLHFFEDDDAHAIIDGIRSWMVPGSYLVLSTGTAEGLDERKLQQLDAIYTKAGARALPRTRVEITSFFDGFELVAPGLTSISAWRADGPEIRTKLLCGVGRRLPARRLSTHHPAGQ